MASGSPHHRSTQSVSTTNLRLPGAAQGSSPTPVQQRRMTSPVGSLTLPDGGRRPSPRPPSPLRNGFVMDTGTGIDPNTSYDGSDGDHDDDDDDDDPAKWHRSPSPASSVSHLAASFVQRMNSFVGGIAPKSPVGMPTDAELEAEAERERDRSRREAEAILTREAQQRKLVEERVLAMMESAKSLPPPPSRSQTMSSNPPSPSNSQKETNWWTAAKNKLTPTKDKEPLTPAQQVIQDAKAREKKGGKGKDKEKEKEWPSNSQGKYNDPAFANLNIPVAPPTRKPVPSSPSSPTPSRPSLSNMPPNLTPSPMRTTDTISSSPSREAPPMYAQFNAQGTLDVPGTLLAIAKRFEKLEKWTVGHVRALEDRMNDVEKWLVDKENEKNTATAPTTPLQAEQTNSDAPDVRNELHEIREEMSELQGRVGELGREMAKMATAPSNLSSGPRIQTATTISPAPQTTTASSFTIKQDHTGSSIPSTPRHPRLSSSTALETTSPPIASKNKTPSGTRLPYPQGDYTSPPDAFSPTNSPPGSINASMRSQSISISGLPNTASSTTMYSSSGSYSSISSFGGRTMSPSPMSPSRSTASVAAAARAISPTPVSTGLPPPSKPATQRQTSVSPTPRKRYTVALGGPLTAPDELSASSDAKDSKRGRGSGGYKSKSTFGDDQDDDDDDDGSEFGAGEETIGKSAAARLVNSGSLGGRAGGGGDYKQQQNPAPAPAPALALAPFESSSASPSSSNNNTNGNSSSRRVRAQSAYGFSSIAAGSNSISATILSNIHTTPTPTSSGTALPSVAPLKPRIRSKSSERLNSHSHSHSGSTGGDGMMTTMFGGTTPTTTKFVDPLVLRRQSKDSLMMGKPNIAMPKPVVGRKVPIGQLVAFFDGDKK